MIQLRSLAALIVACFPPLLAPVSVYAANLQSILERYLEKEQLPGGVLLVSAPGRREIVAAGIADRQSGRPITPKSRFYIASVGKMTVAVTALQLVEDGTLSLESKVSDLVDGIPHISRLPNFQQAKLGQLLDHSSGIPDYLTDAFYRHFHAHPARLTPAAVIPFAFEEDAPFRAGRGHDYSNTNYVLLGAIIATAEHKDLESALQNHVLTRAGMAHTTVGATARDDSLAHGYATPEGSDEEEDVSLLSWNSPLGDGPLVSTAEDLEAFTFSLFRDGKLLSPASLTRMTAPSKHDPEYGMGVERGSDQWGDWFGHTGLEDGFEAEVRYYPDHKAALVFLTNGNSQSDSSILDKAAKALFETKEK